jgi:hypothetical protein
MLSMSKLIDGVFAPSEPYVSKTPDRGPRGRMVALKAATSYVALQWLAWPTRPRTLFAWAIVVGVLVLLAWARWRWGNIALHNPIADRIQARNAHRKHSGERMAYLLTILLCSIVLLVAAVRLSPWVAAQAGPELPRIARQHFY